MQNTGEEITGEYLRHILGCNFVNYNVDNPDVAGEIDVVAVKTECNLVYLCEVAIHTKSGVRYVTDKQPDNVNRFLSKFKKNIAYANKYFSDYEKRYMLWTPIVRNQRATAKHNQLRDMTEIMETLRADHGIVLELVINHSYANCLAELREYAALQSREMKSPVLRLMQIEGKLTKHLANLT